MSIRVRFLAGDDMVSRIRRVLPGARDADFAALAVMIDADKLLTAEGAAHPAFVNWVAGILDRDAGEPMAVPVVPMPKTGPAGAEVMA